MIYKLIKKNKWAKNEAQLAGREVSTDFNLYSLLCYINLTLKNG